MLYFATLFDINYLSRGLALLSSLKEHSSKPFQLFILALDNNVLKYFEQHPDEQVNVITLILLEQHYPELLIAKANRSTIEYYFTLSPYLPLYILEEYPQVNQITTMDSDIYFFSDPAVIFEKFTNASILITPHNFSASALHFKAYGSYNVSFQSFKNNDTGLQCLQEWRKECFGWCYDTYDRENGRFADQKYLDTWKQNFPDVYDIDLPGAGLAPWNIEKFEYEISNNRLFVNGELLIYYHYHHLRIFSKNLAYNGLEFYSVQIKRKAIRYIYHTYLKKLNSFTGYWSTDKNIKRYDSLFKNGLFSKLKHPNGYWFFNNMFIVHLNLYRTYHKIKNMLHG